ncbi:hypothetical protein JR316_0011534 [Psilocybe cubensis]|uniref:Uncharacterized protein n=2 Tax=Psilocybe cubensis TaxID=181762 RepID=A0ACB8GLN6_PSICU|nr:hypothetical protein JR316_0011534 [Psilocybe cubensis]KAH9475969.1 hypothetical protein JR316_0011534 [Psilocybe cubensis]
MDSVMDSQAARIKTYDLDNDGVLITLLSPEDFVTQTLDGKIYVRIAYDKFAEMMKEKQDFIELRASTLKIYGSLFKTEPEI